MSTPTDLTRSLQRFVTDQPLLSTRVIPSAAALPLAAQRDFRGWIMGAILALVVIGMTEVALLIHAVAGRTACVAPTAERLGTGSLQHQVSDAEVALLAMLLVGRLESYTPATAAHIYDQVLPFLHPSLQQTVQSQYQSVAQHAAALWQSRLCLCLGVAMGGRKAGIIMTAVFFDSVELTGRDEGARTLSGVVPKAAYVEWFQDVPSVDNPTGLVISSYHAYERADWLARGFPDLWATYRTPGPAPARSPSPAQARKG